MKTETQIEKNDEKIKQLKFAVEKQEELAVEKPETETWVRGVFKNYHTRGAPLAFFFQERFVTLKPDEEVDIPLRMVQHLDNSCKRAVRKTVRTTPDNSPGVMGDIVPVKYENLYEFLVRETYEGKIW